MKVNKTIIAVTLVIIGILTLVLLGLSSGKEYYSEFTEPMTEEDALNILNLTSTATENEIKKAYRKMSIKYHPDKNPNYKDNDSFGTADREDIKFINKAYEMLLKQKEGPMKSFEEENVTTENVYNLFMSYIDKAYQNIKRDNLTGEALNIIKEYMNSEYVNFSELLNTLSEEEQLEIVQWYHFLLKLIDNKIQIIEIQEQLAKLKDDNKKFYEDTKKSSQEKEDMLNELKKMNDERENKINSNKNKNQIAMYIVGAFLVVGIIYFFRRQK